ncbi:hypothetical protein CCACVL1_14037 [Corchorus capsularis]|uniref:Uncharacterized protein n=1 Tax=Corchorus capsularis TaxID=210143 RepID=A0A1R3I8P5_COCAP|nr:hypothetical protein CCACVL1_14037 [Corchorus capsularis]
MEKVLLHLTATGPPSQFLSPLLWDFSGWKDTS